MMCRYELGPLRGSTSLVTMTENRTEKQPEDGPRAKFLCSFGGSILPRPSDGKLRYAGGETRMVSVSRDISYRELMVKMKELYDQALTVKYQHPDEDLDALVSVLCDDDVANMMDEYDKLEATHVSGRLRLFLFSAAEHHDFPSVDANGHREQRYVDALNGLPESSKQPEMAVVGNGIEAGIAQHVSRALPVSSMQPFFPVGSPSLSSPSSPSHPRQAPVRDQYYPRKSSSNHHYAPNNNVSQHESYLEIAGASAIEFPPKAQVELNTGIHNSGFVFDREYKQNVEAFMANAEPRGSPRQNSSEFDWQHVNVQSGIEIGEDREIPDLVPVQFNMQNLALPQEQQMLLAYHQAAGHGSARAYGDHELVYRNHHDEIIQLNSLQKKPFLHPLVRQEEQQQHPKNDNGIERSWTASCYASGSELSHNFSSLLNSGNGSDYCMVSAPLVCQVDFGNAYQQHMQAHWACDECGSRADYGSNELSGNFVPLNSCPPYNSHMCSDKPFMWHQQPAILGEDMRFQVQNLNHLQSMFEGNSATAHHYAAVQARQNLSEVWGSDSYQQHLPPHLDQPGSNKVHFQTPNQGGEYHRVMSEKLSEQNASADVDQTRYSIEQNELHSSFQDELDKSRGWAFNRINHQTEEVRMTLAGNADGVCVADENMHRNFGQNIYLNCYSGSYFCVNPGDPYHAPLAGDFYEHTISNQDELQTHAPVIVESGSRHGNFAAMYGSDSFLQDLKTPELEKCLQSKPQHVITRTCLDCVSGVHLQSNNGASCKLLPVVEERGLEVASGKKDGRTIERMEHSNVLYESNTAADVPNVPRYMSDDLLPKHINNAGDDHHHFTGPQLIKSITVASNKAQAGFEGGALTTRESTAFVAPGSNKALPDHTSSCIMTSSIAFVHDGPTISSSFEVLPSVSSSSPARSNSLTSITLPVYEQSPANSMKVTVPEDFCSENERGRRFKELEAKAVADNNRMRSVTGQLEVEVNSNGLGALRQDVDVDKGMSENCLNDKSNVDICSSSRPMDSSVHHLSPSSSSVSLGSNVVAKQASAGNGKEVVYKEDTDEAVLPISDAKEESGKREVPEHYPSGVDEDSGSDSVDIAKSVSSEAEVQALARGLQTIRNADLEEIRELGSGTYGTVYHGKWKGSDVAIKRIKASCFAGRPSERERLIADFWKEASILSQLHHPNVVSFYGVVRDGPGGTLATVTEFMVNGSLKQVLHKKDRTIDRRKRLILAMDAAFGMEYLHGKNIVHFDLKCENLLVNMRDPHRPVCKIGDMGLSKVKHQTLVSGGVRGTLPWMAPELLSGKSGMVTDKVDVYSFGIVMWELLTGDEPYASMHCGSIIGGIMNNTLRPPIPSWCDPAWRSLMEKCWSADPGQRPSFSDIAKELRAVAASINLK